MMRCDRWKLFIAAQVSDLTGEGERLGGTGLGRILGGGLGRGLGRDWLIMSVGGDDWKSERASGMLQ